MRFATSDGIGEIDNLPGSSQVAVIHSCFVPLSIRNEGHGSTAHWRRLEDVKNLGYDLSICTVDLNNKPELSILKKNKWIHLTSFKSTKTGHKVGLFARGINQKIELSREFPLHTDKSESEIYYPDYINPETK